MALNASISGSILALPDACLVMMMELPFGSARAMPPPKLIEHQLYPFDCLPARGHYDPLQQRGEVPLAREQRKLAAILAADVVGYSRLMGRDESGTLARLAAISSRIVAA